MLEIFVDFLQTLKIFLLPCFIMIAAFVMTLMVMSADPIGYSPKLGIVTLIAIGAFCLLWSAVNFHRKILLSAQIGWVPPVHFREMLSYGIMCIPFLLILGALLFFAGTLATHIVPFGMPGWWYWASAYMLAVYLVVTILSLYLFSQLPGLAIGEHLQQVFRRGSGARGTLALIAVIVMVAGITATTTEDILLSVLFPDTDHLPSKMLLVALAGYRLLWLMVSVIIQLSLVTTLYGYYGKGRPLR
ncbi:hypothetical protein JJJ17_13475 [Paracoccus caeni]|uniref:Uncharacterized protein n=1 Tax=Paracoccus caeni TaxID=657651 RepID=A0A934SFI4_9RHOB|nr:hypothetical protein [Paracoccus caeni]MBK4216942.1 hypothetical protein [Paracoccus caeni]